MLKSRNDVSLEKLKHMKKFIFQLIGILLFGGAAFSIFDGILQLDHSEFLIGWISCMGAYTGESVHDSLQ
jgi:hypothetical protein